MSPGAFYVTNPRTSALLVQAAITTPFVWIGQSIKHHQYH